MKYGVQWELGIAFRLRTRLKILRTPLVAHSARIDGYEGCAGAGGGDHLPVENPRAGY